MGDLLQLRQRIWIGEDHVAQLVAVNLTPGVEHPLAEGINNWLVGRSAGGHGPVSQTISINAEGIHAFQHPPDDALPGSDISGQSDDDLIRPAAGMATLLCWQ